jgi:hypothetical protein
VPTPAPRYDFQLRVLVSPTPRNNICGLFEEFDHFQEMRIQDADRLPKFPTHRRPPRAAGAAPSAHAPPSFVWSAPGPHAPRPAVVLSFMSSLVPYAPPPPSHALPGFAAVRLCRGLPGSTHIVVAPAGPARGHVLFLPRARMGGPSGPCPSHLSLPPPLPSTPRSPPDSTSSIYNPHHRASIMYSCVLRYI